MIYALKSNPAVQNTSDLKGKRIGFGHMYSSGSFHLGAEVAAFLLLTALPAAEPALQLMMRGGVHLYTDPAQVTNC